jgi:hypothetical protein
MPEFPRNPNGRPWITSQRRRFISVASANATRCRIAFDSDGLSSRSAAHASTARRSSGGMRTPTIGECPVAGRPRLLFLCLTPIVIKDCLTQNPLSGTSRNRRPRGKAGTKPQGLPQQPFWCRAISRGGTLCSASFDQPVEATPALPMERPLPRRGGFTLFPGGSRHQPSRVRSRRWDDESGQTDSSVAAYYAAGLRNALAKLGWVDGAICELMSASAAPIPTARLPCN